MLKLPDGLFSGMIELTTLHLSAHASLARLPPLESLPKLETIFLGQLESLDDLPSLGDLPSLKVAAFLNIPRVQALPDLSIYQDTLEALVVQDMALCCNGFLSNGNCNTSFPTCCATSSSSTSLVTPSIVVNAESISFAVHAGGINVNHVEGNSYGRNLLAQDPPQCLDLPADNSSLPSNATLAFLERFMSAESGTFCDAALATCRSPQSKYGLENVSVSIDVCKGILYRQCSSKAKGAGICYNPQLGRVQCVHSESVIAMRAAAIAAGCSCDAREERWLGCE